MPRPLYGGVFVWTQTPTPGLLVLHAVFRSLSIVLSELPAPAPCAPPESEAPAGGGCGRDLLRPEHLGDGRLADVLAVGQPRDRGADGPAEHEERGDGAERGAAHPDARPPVLDHGAADEAGRLVLVERRAAVAAGAVVARLGLRPRVHHARAPVRGSRLARPAEHRLA